MTATYSVEWVVQVAINAIDKPSELHSAPESALRRILEADGPEVFEAALVKVRELLALNSHDFVAAGAERLLEDVLAEGTVAT